MVNMRQSNEQSVCHSPLNGSPIVGHKQVRPELSKRATNGQQSRRQIPALWRECVDRAAYALPNGILGIRNTIERNHMMVILRPEIRNDSCHAERNAANPKAGKHMQTEWS
jgi:hypothetical protein